MKIDLEYMRLFLKVFVDSPEPFISTGELVRKGFIINKDKGLFHILLLCEQGFISDMNGRTGNPEYLGLTPGMGGAFYYGDTDIRLTAKGLDFAQSLEDKDVFEKLKGISNAPISVIKDVGLELLKSYAKKQFGLSD